MESLPSWDELFSAAFLANLGSISKGKEEGEQIDQRSILPGTEAFAPAQGACSYLGLSACVSTGAHEQRARGRRKERNERPVSARNRKIEKAERAPSSSRCCPIPWYSPSSILHIERALPKYHG